MTTEDKERLKKLAHQYRNAIAVVGITSVFVALKTTGALEDDFISFLNGVALTANTFLGYRGVKQWLNEEKNKANQIERA